MERLSKAIVAGSILFAVFANARLATAGSGSLLPAAIAVFALVSVAARWYPRPVRAAVLAVTYALPAMALFATGAPRPLFSSVWSAGVLAVVLTGRAPLRWHAARPWRPILIMWTSAIAITWPIVAFRELDFTWTLLHRFSPPSTGRGLWPDFVIGAITHDAATIGVGLLWFDWLFGEYADDPPGFLRSILLPLAAAALAAIAVGVVQGFVDIRFLNDQPWVRLRRAPGTLADANAFGMVAALWAPAFIALARARGGKLAAAGGVLAATMACLAFSVSGSRTAALAGSVGLAGAAFYYRADLAAIRRRRTVAAAAAAALCTFALAASLPRQTVGPVARMLRFDSLAFDSPRRIAFDLWDRDLYGTVATMMIRRHPLVGVGTGSFAFLSMDVTAALGRPSPADNAQNWFRHQFAELGLLGSVGWIAWTAVLVSALWRGRRARATPVDGKSIGGALAGFGAASLVGGPGLHPAVALTFLTFAFWYVAFPAHPEPVSDMGRPRARIAVAAACVVVLHAIGTAVVARSDLRVPARAARFGWPYSYGFYDTEAYPFRWTDGRAVATFEATGGVLRVAFHIAHPDAAAHPVGVRITVNGEPVFDAELRDPSIVVRDVTLHTSQPYVLLEARTSRTWRPSDYQQTDTRRLGVAIRWEFAAAAERSGP